MCLLLLLLVAIVLPIAEYVVASAVADQVGWGVTLAALLGLMLIGSLVIRGPQRWAWREAGRAGQGGPPVAELTARALVLGLSGGLLIFPGFLTAAVGLILLLPPVNRGIARYLARRFREQVAAAGAKPPGAAGYWRMTTVRRVRTEGPTVVEGSVVRADEPQESPPSDERRGSPPAGEITAGGEIIDAGPVDEGPEQPGQPGPERGDRPPAD